jgi:hypothetical protein
MKRRFQIGFDFNSTSSGMRELLAGVRDERHSGQWHLHGLMLPGLTPMSLFYGVHDAEVQQAELRGEYAKPPLE